MTRQSKTTMPSSWSCNQMMLCGQAFQDHKRLSTFLLDLSHRISTSREFYDLKKIITDMISKLQAQEHRASMTSNKQTKGAF